MFYNDEPNETPYHINPETISRNRPPQLNEAACGCRCGCCCNGACEEGCNRQNDEETLVASDDSVDEESNANAITPERHVTTEPDEPSADIRARIGLAVYMHRAESQHVMGIEEVSIRPRLGTPAQASDDTDSLTNNPPHASDEHSAVTSIDGSIRGISPGPGMGSWITEDVHIASWATKEDVHMKEYHFLVRPLRLTPQHRYCRGLVASHLVVRDEITFMDFEDGPGMAPLFRAG